MNCLKYIQYTNFLAYLRPFYHEFIKHLYKTLFKSEYRRYFWLLIKYGGTPRYISRNIKFNNWIITVVDVASFLSAYYEIFVEEIYSFHSDISNPIILDCGANVGVSILYFKNIYPDSKIIAYEADPFIFKILESNLKQNNVLNVELHNQAIWHKSGNVEFSIEGADGGRINSGKDNNLISVSAVNFKEIVKKHKFAFIKIDIEGTEKKIFKGCEEILAGLKHIFVEYHSFEGQKQELGKLIRIFESIGFRVYIHPQNIQRRPFIKVLSHMGMDMQLNLFFINKNIK